MADDKTVQDFRDVNPASSEHLAQIRPISQQTAVFWKFAEQGNEGKLETGLCLPPATSE
jgi:hypothetical protein